MVEPITTAILLKVAAGVAGKLAVKAYFLTKMAALKTFLTNYIGYAAANTSVTILAGAAAVIFWETKVKGSSDEDAITAAVAKGVTREVARGILLWLSRLA